MPVSVAIAVKNEENNMARCLDSVQWADEVVVVDGNSTDLTADICRGYKNVRFFENDCGRDFHVNKNLAADRASARWILSLDADEVIPPALGREILRAVQDENKIAFYLIRKNYFLGRWIRGCGWYPDKIIRLFQKGSTRWPLLKENFHGTPQIKERDKVGCLEEPFFHYSYTSLEQYLRKFNEYTSAVGIQEFSKGKRVTFYTVPLFFMIKPLYYFFRKFILLSGFRDGFRRFFISASSALTVFFTYAKLWEIQIRGGSPWDEPAARS